MKKVIAKTDGFYRGVRIRQGQSFLLKDGDKLGKWMKEVALKTNPGEALTVDVAVPSGKKAKEKAIVDTTATESDEAETNVTEEAETNVTEQDVL